MWLFYTLHDDVTLNLDVIIVTRYIVKFRDTFISPEWIKRCTNWLWPSSLRMKNLPLKWAWCRWHDHFRNFGISVFQLCGYFRSHLRESRALPTVTVRIATSYVQRGEIQARRMFFITRQQALERRARYYSTMSVCLSDCRSVQCRCCIKTVVSIVKLLQSAGTITLSF